MQEQLEFSFVDGLAKAFFEGLINKIKIKDVMEDWYFQKTSGFVKLSFPEIIEIPARRKNQIESFICFTQDGC